VCGDDGGNNTETKMTIIKWHFEVKGIAVEMVWDNGWRVMVADASKLERAEMVARELNRMGERVSVWYSK
jgi:hypothetical protein